MLKNLVVKKYCVVRNWNFFLFRHSLIYIILNRITSEMLFLLCHSSQLLRHSFLLSANAPSDPYVIPTYT